MKKLFCFPALELFCCLPLWKTVLFVSSRAFLLSIPTFLLSTPVENSEATRKKLQNATNSKEYWKERIFCVFSYSQHMHIYMYMHVHTISMSDWWNNFQLMSHYVVHII